MRPRIIGQAVKPMQSIDSVRIMQVDALNAGSANAQAGDGLGGLVKVAPPAAAPASVPAVSK